MKKDSLLTVTNEFYLLSMNQILKIFLSALVEKNITLLK